MLLINEKLMVKKEGLVKTKSNFEETLKMDQNTETVEEDPDQLFEDLDSTKLD